MGPIFRTNDHDLQRREVQAIATADILLAGEVNGATKASLQRLRDRCLDAKGEATRESATKALEESIDFLCEAVPTVKTKAA